MFNKGLLASITLDKKRLKNNVEGSCIVECMPTVSLLSETEMNRLKYLLNEATDILRKSYIRGVK
jgi:hypothetical protein